MREKIVLIAIFGFLIGSAPGVVLTVAQATTTPDNVTAGTSSDPISDFVREELSAQGDKLKGYFWAKIRAFFKSVGNFFREKIGVNIYEGVKLFGEFLFWLFEALAKVIRWLLTLF